MNYIHQDGTLNEFKKNGEIYELISVKGSIEKINENYYAACDLNNEQLTNVSIEANDTYDSILKKKNLYSEYCHEIESQIQERNKTLREQLLPD